MNELRSDYLMARSQTSDPAFLPQPQTQLPINLLTSVCGIALRHSHNGREG